MSNRVYSDRSTAVTMQSCPRSRWYSRESPNDNGLVTGVVPNKLNIDLAIGLGFHEGVNQLLIDNSVDKAVEVALYGSDNWDGFWPMAKSRGFESSDNEDVYYKYHEAAAMVEALVRGYEAFVLPQLLERYTVVEAEMDEHATFVMGDFELTWGGRSDALLLEKETNNLHILSLKTKKEWKWSDEKTNGYDMQGLSETAVVEQRLQKWQSKWDGYDELNKTTALALDSFNGIPNWFYKRASEGGLPEVQAVKMEFALKGRKSEFPEGSGRWTYSNHLIRPWKRTEDLGGNNNYAYLFKTKDDYGHYHTLSSKSWKRVNIWEDIGVKKWIEILKNESIQGTEAGSGLSKMFVLPVEYFRNKEDIERWKRKVLYQEKRVAEGRKAANIALSMNSPLAFEDVLDNYFPMHSDYPSSCVYCPYEGVCYGPKQYMMNPMESGMFVSRTANHLVEISGGD